MPTGSSRALLGRALGLALLVTPLAACSDDAPGSPPAVTPSARVPADVVGGLTRALERRAIAVRHHDAAAFEAGLDAREPRFARGQRTYLANLAQLPLARYRYALDPGSLVREGDAYWVVVDVTMQLEGYDDRPVTTADRYRFTSSRKHPRRFLLASVTDRAWESSHDVQAQPWDSGPIQVRTGDGVLGVFDAASVAEADGIIGSVQRGIDAVAAAVPYPWSRSVVVYALSDTVFMSSIRDLPGGDPETLDGVAFPVASSPDGGRVAATRFLLSPAMLDRPGAERDRLVRHELTHVAVGEHDDRAPAWLSEGLAEYVSVRPLAPEDRLVPEDAVTAAEAGVTGLPGDATFNDADSGVHYALSWWACEWLAQSYGEPTLWTLLDDLDVRGADPEEVLRADLGIGEHELARQGAKLLVLTFDPESLVPTEPPSPSESPSGSPSGPASGTPSGSPSGSPTGSPSR
jgi:hypothetical protein